MFSFGLITITLVNCNRQIKMYSKCPSAFSQHYTLLESGSEEAANCRVQVSGASVNFKQRLCLTWEFINCVWPVLKHRSGCPFCQNAVPSKYWWLCAVYFTDAVVLAKSQCVGCRASACATEPFVSLCLNEYHNQLKSPHHQDPQPINSLEIKSLW